MALKSKSLWITCLLIVIGWAGASQAVLCTDGPGPYLPCYSLGAGSGGQTQIGDGLLLPAQPTTIAGTPAGTLTMFPLLLIPPNPAKVVAQTTGPMPKKMKIPPGTFKNKALKGKVGVAINNPAAFQVETNIEFSAPAAAFGSATASAGGRTGAAIYTIQGLPTGPLGQVRFVAGANQFGGPSRLKVIPVTPIGVWAHSSSIVAPCKHPAFGGNSLNTNDSGCIAIMVAALPMTLGVGGASVAHPAETTPGGVLPGNLKVVSVPTSMGLIAKFAPTGMTAPISNMATTEGFPFTTGRITIDQPAAKGSAENFVLSGMDARDAAGIGTISLVTGGLSDRVLTGPNANRGWARYNLPEPGAVLGAAAALAVLGVCHGLVRRRSR